jgi:urease accessory protein
MSILSLLQLASSPLPVGAYCYSEGLEILVEKGIINNNITLKQWLEDGLKWGSIRIETALMLRAYNAARLGDFTALNYWNGWASATRESDDTSTKLANGANVSQIITGYSIALF